MDLRGLAALAVKILTLIDSGNGAADAPHHSTHDPLDLYSLSRLLQRRGNPTRARELYETALHVGLPHPVERLAQRELAHLAKRELDYTRATSLWEELRQAPKVVKSSDAGIFQEDAQRALEAAIEAAEQLAIYYEHRAKQPQRAAELTSHALAELRGAQLAGEITAARAHKIEGRLARRLLRLERRCVIRTTHKLLRAGNVL
jgi:hypothetical protein